MPSRAPISASDRIRELWDINAQVPTLLSSAGQAINALTDRPILPPTSKETMTDGPATRNGSTNNNESQDAHKQAFTASAKAYFTNLQAILARLRRQAYALEEAGIIAPAAPVLSNSRDTRDTPIDDADKVANGGFGNVDVGVLNSRINRVGLEKETELVRQVKELFG